MAFSRIPTTHTVVPATRRRLQQGITALFERRKRVTLPAHYDTSLPGTVVASWNRLSAYDQQHLLAVAKDLHRSGAPQTVVLAGVLHDIGKGSDTTILTRASVVLLKRFTPSIANRIRRSPSPAPGLKGIHLLLNHADNGARLLEASGVRQEIVWLVRHHESMSTHPYLLALQRADNRH